MQNKNNLNINIGEHPKMSADHQPAEEFSLESVPIYSMRKDLEMLKNTSLSRQESAPPPISSDSQQASSPKISPFLEKADLIPTTSISQKKPENSAIKSIVEQSLESETSDSSRKFDLKKIFVFSIIFLSVIALGIGSYYFWIAKGENSEPLAKEVETATPSLIEESAIPVAIVEPEIKVEEPKENTIVLDLENSTSANIKTEIKNQIEKLPQGSLAEPVEFKLRDSQNNLISFSSFAQKSGLTFAQNLSVHLGESFSLLAFNDGSNLGTGLIIESKNDSLLTQALLKKEASLPKDLNILFLLDVPPKTKSASFSNFTYKDITLRYFNLISQEKLSIDYAIAKNKLLIGTTRNTLTALYDWLSLQLDTP